MSRRGVHLQPSAYYGGWMADPDQRAYWLDLLASMGMSYAVMLTDGDSCLEEFDGKPAVAWLLERGIEPIIREYALLPYPFSNQATVRRAAQIYATFGKTPHWILWNEPQDEREWYHGKVPSDWWEVFVNLWKQAAPQVIAAGGLPGFPDGPGYDFDRCHPFRDTLDLRYLWDNGLAWYAAHCYGKGRPLDYPYDRVTQYGRPYSQAEYDADLDVYAGDPNWANTPPLSVINEGRQGWADPGRTILQDDTCWWAWKKILWHSRETLGHTVQIAVTEGGWVPRDRPGGGGGQPIDDRWALTTPQMVAKKTLTIMEEDSPLFAICPWLLGCSLMGATGWEFDSWVTGAYRPQYWLELPVVQALQGTGPEPEPDVAKARALLAKANVLLGEAEGVL